MSKLRFRVVETAFKKKAVEVATPAERPSEYFGKYVFNKEKMFKYLPSKVYNALIDAIDNGAPLDRSIADEVAAGMKKWAVEMGVTHYTHWFAPLTEGTAEKPIVFTSDQAAGSRDYGDWGGLILCGNAPVNANEPQIEGGPRTVYGGDNPEDNSGIVKYVRIEFAGYPLEPNKEINGLTCGGVGRGTTLEYIQVAFCGDDSFEWFGGTVNAKHLIAYKGWDDEFDTDYGYSGKLQFLLGVRDPKVADTSKSNGFESDNDANGSGNEPLTNPIFSNVTLIGPFYGESAGKAESEILYTTEDAANGAKGGQFQAAMHIRRNSALNVYNSVFTGWPYGLYLQGANAGATVKNVIFAGMWENFKDDASKSYFETTGLNNQVYASSNDLIAKNADYSSVVVDKIGGADFSDSVLSDSFFDKVTYKGAFDGTNDWTKGWANWDPQNTAY
jgi:hypothetical protein